MELDTEIWYHKKVKQKSFTLRMPEAQYIEATKRKGKSLNQFVLEAVEEKLIRERQAEYAAGFASLAGPIDDETRAWIDAQRDAMRHIDG